jgi:2'-5' RNA ligase
MPSAIMRGVAAEQVGYRAGLTALVVVVPEVESVVGRWRQEFDPSAAVGVPAHVTVLSPFLDEPRIDGEVLDALTEVFGAYEAFDQRFDECGRFPEVLYLAPTPDEHFRLLTKAVTDRWPQCLPYGGRFDDVVPHLTIGVRGDHADFDAIEADVAHALPIGTRVSSAALLVYDGARWSRRTDFPLR